MPGLRRDRGTAATLARGPGSAGGDRSGKSSMGTGLNEARQQSMQLLIMGGDMFAFDDADVGRHRAEEAQNPPLVLLDLNAEQPAVMVVRRRVEASLHVGNRQFPLGLGCASEDQ